MSVCAPAAPLLLSSPVRPSAVYRTLYRGDYAFRVQVYTPDLGVEVYHESIRRGGMIETYVYRRVWVGEDRHGPMKHRGGSLLFEQSDRLYLYVGESVVAFRSLHPIVDYHHVMGPRSILYPVAIDSAGHHYPLYCNYQTDFGLPIIPSAVLESMQEWDAYNVWYHKPMQKDKRILRAAHSVLVHVDLLSSSDDESDDADDADDAEDDDVPDDRLVTVRVHLETSATPKIVMYPAAYGATALLHALELTPSQYTCRRTLRSVPSSPSLVPGELPVYRSPFDLHLATDGDDVHILPKDTKRSKRSNK